MTTTSLLMPSVLFTDGVKSEVAVEKSDAVSAQHERRFRLGSHCTERADSTGCL